MRKIQSFGAGAPIDKQGPMAVKAAAWAKSDNSEADLSKRDRAGAGLPPGVARRNSMATYSGHGSK